MPLVAADGQESHDMEKSAFAVNAEVYKIEDIPDRAIARRFGIFGPLLCKLFDTGVEARGVERVLEHQRESKNIWNNFFMWLSINVGLLSIPVGALGQHLFSLTLPHAIATILGFGALGCMATAFISTLGPQTGLRTMIVARYSSGYIGGIFYSVINIIAQFGFAITGVIVGGQTLASINPGTLPLVVGIIVIGTCALIPCFIGYNMVHTYERYAWIATMFIMCCLYGLGSKAGYDLHAQMALEDTGRALSSDILGFGGAIFGATAGWAPVAADYNCRLPANTNPWRVFLLTFWGAYLPLVFVILGATLMTITNPDYVTAFGADGNTGALIAKVLSPWGGIGKFFLVMLAMSIVANNIPTMYSAALSIQALGRPFAVVPRFLWVIFIFLVYTTISIAGREYFIAIMSNLLSMLGYWTAFFVVILAEEHFLFRRKEGRLRGYNLEDWDKPSKLPMGIAGMLACCFGLIGAVVGMMQTWYVGPIAKVAGTASRGADLGFELSAGFAAVTFPPLRWLEIRLTGR